jgi:hypothetical protein
MVISRERKIITRVFVRRVSVSTSGDLKGRHKGWFITKKKAFVMKLFTTKTLCPCGDAIFTKLYLFISCFFRLISTLAYMCNTTGTQNNFHCSTTPVLADHQS